MPDPTIITSLGVPGLALSILWMSHKLSVAAMERKDAAHTKERQEQDNSHREERAELMKRLDQRDEAFRTLERDVRGTLSTTIMESSNVIREAVLRMGNK